MSEDVARTEMLAKRDASGVPLAQALPDLIQKILEWCAAISEEPFFIHAPESYGRSPGKNMARLRKLYLKSVSRELSLGIAGEPYCGKSSFINAFLDCRILPHGIPGDNYSMPIVFSHSSRPVLKIYGNDDQILEHPCQDLASLSQMLEKKAKKPKGAVFDSLHCLWDFPALPAGFGLIRLPSLANLEPLSSRARDMAAFCDVLLVLGHINSPLSLALVEDVKRLRGERAENCVFIATACDLLAESGLKRMRTYYSSRLKDRFGARPPFYFVSALATLEENQKKEGNCIYNKEKFAAFRQNLVETLEPIRIHLILGACLREALALTGEFGEILEIVKASLQEHVQAVISGYEKRRVERIDKIKVKFQEMSECSLKLLEQEAQTFLDNMRTILLHKLADCDNAVAMRIFAVKQIPLLLEIFTRQFVRQYEASLNEQLKRNRKRINFKYDLEWQMAETGMSGPRLREIFEQGGEFAKCKASLADIAGDDRSRSKMSVQKAGLNWLSGLLDGLDAFTSTLLDRSQSVDLKRTGKNFREIIDNCFDSLGGRISRDLNALYEKETGILLNGLVDWLETKDEMGQDESFLSRDLPKALRNELSRLKDYEDQLIEFIYKIKSFRKLLITI